VDLIFEDGSTPKKVALHNN